MDVPYQVLKTERDMLPAVLQKSFNLMCNCSKTLWSMSKSDKNKDVMRRSGIIPVMAKLLTSVHEDVVSSIMGIIVNCATQVYLDRNFIAGHLCLLAITNYLLLVCYRLFIYLCFNKIIIKLFSQFFAQPSKNRAC